VETAPSACKDSRRPAGFRRAANPQIFRILQFFSRYPPDSFQHCGQTHPARSKLRDCGKYIAGLNVGFRLTASYSEDCRISLPAVNSGLGVSGNGNPCSSTERCFVGCMVASSIGEDSSRTRPISAIATCCNWRRITLSDCPLSAERSPPRTPIQRARLYTKTHRMSGRDRMSSIVIFINRKRPRNSAKAEASPFDVLGRASERFSPRMYSGRTLISIEIRDSIKRSFSTETKQRKQSFCPHETSRNPHCPVVRHCHKPPVRRYFPNRAGVGNAGAGSPKIKN